MYGYTVDARAQVQLKWERVYKPLGVGLRGEQQQYPHSGPAQAIGEDSVSGQRGVQRGV
jgi:hypothetical protein